MLCFTYQILINDINENIIGSEIMWSSFNVKRCSAGAYRYGFLWNRSLVSAPASQTWSGILKMAK